MPRTIRGCHDKSCESDHVSKVSKACLTDCALPTHFHCVAERTGYVYFRVLRLTRNLVAQETAISQQLTTQFVGV